ncbi:helix-hairpin-helix domain-containing protein [Lewinella sp. 4G2]|uniref:helix-hairpin-helix domain-containing protein n=1 Tax=Lewinella sp. 4G2 TaxID=1803372 RepID=UPI0007B4657D|nr:helix-hairpin-helix domain-containing protein [Lewinella sp. 4G2]OAV43754.1 hypothetical protein A3850_004245 [Lewinella sp. 4G2]
MNTLFDQIANFFATLSPQMTSLLAIIGLLVFTLGVVIGWLIQRQSTRHFRQQAILMKTDRDLYESRNATLEKERQTLGRELELVSTEKVEALERIELLEAEVTGWDESTQRLMTKVSQLETTNQTYASTIESLNNQVIGLKTQNEHLYGSGGSVTNGTEGDQGAAPGRTRDELGARAGAEEWVTPELDGEDLPFHQEPDAEKPDAPATEQPVTTTTELEDRLQYLEDRLAQLAEQRQLAEQTPSTLYTVQPPTVPDAGEPLVIRADITAGGARPAADGETEVIVQAAQSLQTPVQPEAEPERDDLTKINKIGPFLEGQLNRVDVYRYEQIASWTEADIENYTELIGYVPGIIKQDDWVGQARSLAAASEPEQAEVEVSEPKPIESERATRAAASPSPQPELAAKSAPAPKEKEATVTGAVPTEDSPNADDENLRIVEGIGPRIQQLLRDQGIDTLGKLAASDTERIQSILDEAGGSFRFHDPKTWVAQAGLAADGKMEELKAWQDQLKGGL